MSDNLTKIFPDAQHLLCRHCKCPHFEVALLLTDRQIYVRCAGCLTSFATGATLPEKMINRYERSSGVIIPFKGPAK